MTELRLASGTRVANKMLPYRHNAILLLSIIYLATQYQQLNGVKADTSVKSALNKFKVIPDYLEDADLSLLSLEAHGNVVKPGDSVPAEKLRSIDMSKLSWKSLDPDSRYTLLVLDLDREPNSNVSQSAYVQFASVNILGNVNLNGQAIVAYESPNVPCQPSKRHRILALVASQAQNIDLKSIIAMSAAAGESGPRESFKLKTFLTRYKLEPVAANAFQAVRDAGGVCSSSYSLFHSHLSVYLLFAIVLASAAVRRSP